MLTGIAARSIAGIVTVIFFVIEGTAAAEGPGGYESEQGARIFGTKDPALEGVFIPYKADKGNQQKGYTDFLVDSGQLQSMKVNQHYVAVTESMALELVGILAPTNTGKPGTPSTVTLRVDKAQLHVNIYDSNAKPTIWEYAISVKNGTQTTPLCDGANWSLVVPIAAPPSDEAVLGFSFACIPRLAPIPDPTPPISAMPRSVTTSTKVSVRPPPVIAHLVVPPIQRNRLNSVSDRAQLQLPIPTASQWTINYHWDGGVAAKCIDYGYAPWKGGMPTLANPTVLGGPMPLPSDAVVRGFFNVCVRAMRADYAGDGRSHTIPGTIIQIFDLTNLPVAVCTSLSCTEQLDRRLPPMPSDAQHVLTRIEAVRRFQVARVASPTSGPLQSLQYEAAWTVDTHGRARALCLARVRWQTLDVNDTQLLEAHTNPGPDSWTYCDKGTLDALVPSQHQIVLVSYSAIMERGLYRFRQGTQTPPRYITTSHVKSLDSGVVEIDAGIQCEAPCQFVGFEGDVLSPDAPHWGFKDPRSLYLYKNAQGDYVTTISQALSGYERVSLHGSALQGYIFQSDPGIPAPPESSNGPGAIARGGIDYITYQTPAQVSGLSLWKRNNRYCSALDACNGYDQPNLLGFVLLPESTRSVRLNLPSRVGRPILLPHVDHGDPEPGQPLEQISGSKQSVPQVLPKATSQPAPK
jgi:hypothetical protein